jgi:hypothetical protein
MIGIFPIIPQLQSSHYGDGVASTTLATQEGRGTARLPAPEQRLLRQLGQG